MLARSRLILLVLGGSLGLHGCFAGSAGAGSGIDDDYMDDPPPPGECVTGCPSPGSDGNPVGGPCLDSSHCAQNAVCAASFDGGVQPFTCQDACIPAMDDTQWCADDRSCCAGMTCSSRGFCLPPDETDGLDASSGTDGSTSTTDRGGDTSSSSSGSSGSTDSGSTG